MKTILTIAALSIILSTASVPCSGNIATSHYVRTNSDGMSSSSITCLHQDFLGRLWVGTMDGLNVYDSHTFWVWKYEPDNPGTISNNVIRGIAEQEGGIMWIATDYGINRIDTSDGSIRKFFPGYEGRTPPGEKMFSVAVIGPSAVICAVKGWGIALYDETSGDMKQVEIPKTDPTGISGIYSAGDGRFALVFSDGSIYMSGYGISGNGESYVADSPCLLPGIRVSNISYCKDGLLIVSDDNVLYRFDSRTFSMSEGIRIPAKEKVYAAAEAGEGRIAIGFNSKGVCTIDMESGNISWIPELSGINVFSLLHGSQDILWAGTDGQGLWAFYNDPFDMKKMTYGQMSGKQARYPARAFYKDRNGNLYIGTKGDGIFVFKDGRKVRSFNTGDGLGSNTIYSIVLGPDDDILVGHERGLDAISGSGRISPLTSGNGCGPVYCILNDSLNNCLWIGTYGYGLMKMKTGKSRDRYSIEHITSYRSDPDDSSSINNDIVQCLVHEDSSVLWAGTKGGGLNRLDINTGKFTHYTMDKGDRPVSNNDILSLYISGDGTLWAGTNFGLNKLLSYREGKCEFESFTTRTGLHNNSIHGIEGDRNGNLWLSTSHGLTFFDTGSGEATNYYNDDKLQDNEFADGAHYTDNDGTIYFGGINGFNWFNPEDISPRKYDPVPLISRITLNQAPDVDLLNGVKSVTLRHNENFFNVYFTALEYINNSNCEYVYMLEGFNKEWVKAGPLRSDASFTNVPPGKYTFKVRCTNGDKIWGDRISSVNIRIMPPWWATIWAYIAYTLTAAVAIYFIYKGVNYRIRQKHRLEMEALKREQMTQTYEAKLRFFTNIAHEFTTPLTLICGPIELIMNEYRLPARVEKYNRIILSNAERMLRLIQELIEFRKVDTGNMKPQYSRINLSETILTILDNFSEFKEEKQINVQTSIGQNMEAVTDRNAMEKILYNLISNAYKYTPDGGTISICAETGENGTRLSIKNTGRGIKPEHIGQVFDRFVILDNYEQRASKGKTLRNGIGMALVSSLVKMLSGEIKVESEPGKYTVFTVSLPAVPEEEADGIAPVNEEEPQVNRDIPELKEPGTGHNEEEQAGDRKSIMVVDDEPQIRGLVSDILGGEYRIIQAADGKEAIEKLKDGLPDLIISDLNMPNMGGIDLIRHLKSSEVTRFIPVIALAFKTDIGDEIETYEMGIDVFISKPFYPKHLKAVVHRVLDSRTMLKSYYKSAISSTDIYDGATVDAEDKKFILQMTSIIEDNITDENLSPNFICEKMAVSRMSLYRKLKELTRQTPSEFIRNVKLERAANLLTTTKMTVQEVMFSSGFNNKSYFYREFAEKYRMSPKEFRQEKI